MSATYKGASITFLTFTLLARASCEASGGTITGVGIYTIGTYSTVLARIGTAIIDI